MTQRYKIADVIFQADYIYTLTNQLLKKYEYSGEDLPELIIVNSQEDLQKEFQNYPDSPPALVENICIFRKFCEYVLERANGLIFHASALAVDGKAYLFTAPSGTGKSTHAKLWQELLGEKVVIVNDDKPLIRLVDGDFYVYGSPWNGKHGLDTDCKVKIGGICQLVRGKTNKIIALQPSQILPIILGQTLRPKSQETMDKLLVLVEQLLKSVPSYKLECNMNIDAAMLSYKTMSRGGNK